MTYYALLLGDRAPETAHGLSPLHEPVVQRLLDARRTRTVSSSHPRHAVMTGELATLVCCLVWDCRRWHCGMDDGYEVNRRLAKPEVSLERSHPFRPSATDAWKDKFHRLRRRVRPCWSV
jgi:hypothetical protein